MSKFQNSGYVPPYCPQFLEDFIRKSMPSGSILDYGCGYGGWTKKLMDIFPSSCMSVFDIDEIALKNTCKSLSVEPDLTPNKSFDSIFLNFVIDAIDDNLEVMNVLSALKNKLNPGGKILIMYTPYEILSLRWIYYQTRSLNVQKWHNKNKFSRVYYNISELIKLINQCGLAVTAKIKPRFFHLFSEDMNKRLCILPNCFHSMVVIVVENK